MSHIPKGGALQEERGGGLGVATSQEFGGGKKLQRREANGGKGRGGGDNGRVKEGS